MFIIVLHIYKASAYALPNLFYKPTGSKHLLIKQNWGNNFCYYLIKDMSKKLPQR